MMAKSAGRPVFERLTARHREACEKLAAIQRHGVHEIGAACAPAR
jgi:hypothetical protein